MQRFLLLPGPLFKLLQKTLVKPKAMEPSGVWTILWHKMVGMAPGRLFSNPYWCSESSMLSEHIWDKSIEGSLAFSQHNCFQRHHKVVATRGFMYLRVTVISWEETKMYPLMPAVTSHCREGQNAHAFFSLPRSTPATTGQRPFSSVCHSTVCHCEFQELKSPVVTI